MDGPIPTRITIDFSGHIDPARGWIIGRVDETSGRVELLSVPREATPPVAPRASRRGSVASASDCTCPDLCDLDHEND